MSCCSKYTTVNTNVNEQNLISLIFPSPVPPCSDTIGTNLNCC